MYEATNTPLYNGASLSKLEALPLIINIKAKNEWINTSIDDLLKYVLFKKFKLFLYIYRIFLISIYYLLFN